MIKNVYFNVDIYMTLVFIDFYIADTLSYNHDKRL